MRGDRHRPTITVAAATTRGADGRSPIRLRYTVRLQALRALALPIRISGPGVGLTRFVESTITFPYKRSLGPVVGAFMTALTEKRILGIRDSDAVLVPPMEWDPPTGAELPPDFVEVGPAGTVESWTWVRPRQNSIPRPSLCFRLHPAGRGDHPPAARGRRRTPEDGGGDAGGSPLAGHPGRAYRRHRLLRPGRAPETEGEDAGPAVGTGAADGLSRVDHLPESGARSHRPGRRGLPGHRLLGLALPRPAHVSMPADGATAPSMPSNSVPSCEVDLPHRAPSPTSPSSPRSTIRARPRPSPSSGPSSFSTTPM